MPNFPTITADTTAIWVQFWNVTFRAYCESLGNGGASALTLLGNGRIAALNTAIGAPQITTALAITIPDGSRYVIGGVEKIADGAITIGNVPANKPNGVYGVLNVVTDTTSQNDVWSVVWSDTKPTAGSGIIGLVKTDADSVTEIVRTDEDIIQPHWIVQARLRVLEAQPAGGGGSGGGATVAQITGLQNEIKALSDTVKLLQAGNADGTTTTQVQSPNERTREELGLQTLFITKLFPAYAQVTKSALIIPGVTGYGEKMPDGSTQPNSGSGNATRDEVNQRIS